MKQNKNGRMGGSTKPDNINHCYIGKTKETGIRTDALEHYLKVSPQFNEPLYTRPVRTVV